MTQFKSATHAGPAAEYLRSRVMSASPQELRLMLLEGGVKYARQGRDALARKDFEGVYNGLTACRNIVLELMTSIRVDPNPELAQRVRSLYTYIYTLLVEGGHEKDLKKLDTVIELLDYERETWLLLMDKLASEQGPAPKADPPAERVPLSIQG